jgi:hypothetical protein
VDHHIERRVLLRKLSGDFADVGGVFDVENNRSHAGVGGDGPIENLLASSRDDDLVAELVKCLCEAAADTGAASGDKNVFPVVVVRLNAISHWRADFKLNLQRYSVLDSELLDTRWNSSAIRNTGFTVGNCTRSRFYVQVDWICKHWPTSRTNATSAS